MNFKRGKGLHDAVKLAHHFLLDQGGGSSVTLEAFHVLLQGCSASKDLQSAKDLYVLMARYGHSDPSLDAQFIRTYARCGSIVDANALFSAMRAKTVQTWNAIVFAHVFAGESEKALQLFWEMEAPGMFIATCILKACTVEGIMGTFQASDLMRKQGISISKNIVLCLLRGCLKTRDIGGGRHAYSLMIIAQLDSHAFLVDHLLRLFALCRCLDDAIWVLDKIKQPSIYTWTTIISGYVELGESERAFDLYISMLLYHQGIKPNTILILSLLKACCSLDTSLMGRLIHTQIMELGLDLDIVIANTVIDMYAKHANLEDARKIFDGLQIRRDVVSWGVMVSGYANCDGFSLAAVRLYKKMKSEGSIPASTVILVSTMKACSKDEVLLSDGQLVHDHAVQCGYESDLNIGTALVDMYAKCGGLEDASFVFDNLPHQNVVSWGALIGGYVERDHSLSALLLFNRMQESAVVPNRVIFLHLMRACSSIGACVHSQLVHDKIIRSGIESDLLVGCTLIDLYAKCERLEATHKVFQMLRERNIVSWSALVGAYVRSGLHLGVESCVEDMKNEGIKPDKVILTSALAAYTHAGLLDEGHQFFSSLVSRSDAIGPSPSQFNGMIDLLCRSGCLDEAKDVIVSIPASADTAGWKALMTGCKAYGNAGLARHCFCELQKGMDLG